MECSSDQENDDNTVNSSDESLEETLDPYQFEPECCDENISNQDNGLESDDQEVAVWEEDGENNLVLRLNSKEWCKCGNCQQQAQPIGMCLLH